MIKKEKKTLVFSHEVDKLILNRNTNTNINSNFNLSCSCIMFIKS